MCIGFSDSVIVRSFMVVIIYCLATVKWANRNQLCV
uniref:Uncharacterized protein n=1 Tax=Anguilla anguilla TaxID=7936 RepID=A0A0E9SWU8_ANGAN